MKEALESIAIKSVEGGGKSTNIIICDPNNKVDADKRLVTLRLSNVPFGVALNYICQMTKTSYHLDGNTVLVGNPNEVNIFPKNLSQHANKAKLTNRQLRCLAGIPIMSIEWQEAPLSDVLDFIAVNSLDFSP